MSTTDPRIGGAPPQTFNPAPAGPPQVVNAGLTAAPQQQQFATPGQVGMAQQGSNGTPISPIAPPSQGPPVFNPQAQLPQAQNLPQSQQQQPGFSLGETPLGPDPAMNQQIPTPNQYQQENYFGPAAQGIHQAAQQPVAQPFNDGLVLGGPAGGQQPPAPAPQTPAPPAQPQPQSVPQQQPIRPGTAIGDQGSTALRDQLAAQGANVGHYINDQHLLSSLNQIPGLRQQAMQAQAQLAQQQPQPQQLQQDQQQSQDDTKWDPRWDSVMVQNEDGYFVPKPGHEASVSYSDIQQANTVHIRRRERAAQLVDDPVSFLQESGALDSLQEQIRNDIAQENRATEASQAIDKFFSDNASMLFVTDSNGNPMSDGMNYIPTQIGSQIQSHMGQFADQFRRNYNAEPDQWMLLQQLQAVSAPYLQQQSHLQAAYDPNQNQQLKDNTIQQAIQNNNGAMYQPQPNNSVVAAAQNVDLAQNTRLDFGAMLRQEGQNRGIF